MSRVGRAGARGGMALVVLAGVVALASGCDDDVPTGGRLFTATERIDGEIPLSGQGTVVLENPIGPVVIHGEAVGPLVRWSLSKTVTAPSAPRAYAGLADIGLATATATDSVRLAAAAPADMTAVSYTALVTLGVPAAMACSITAYAGTAQFSFLAADLNVTGSGPVTVTAHSGNCTIVTGAGDIGVEIALPDAGWCLASVGAGDVALDIPAETSAEVTCTTGAGTITVVGLALTDTDPSPNGLAGTLGAGGGTIRVIAGAGDILLRAF